MGKSQIKRFRTLLLTASLVLTMLICSTVFAAADGDNFHLTLDDTIWLIDDSATILWVDNDEGDSAEILSATSSDPTIAAIQKSAFDEGSGWDLIPLRAGVVTITAEYRAEGKTATVSKECTIKNFPYELKSLKVNGKKVNLKKNKDFYYKKYKGKSVKIKASVKSTWKLTNNIDCFVETKSGKFKNISVSKTKLIKGKSISFPKKYKYFYLRFEMINKNNGDLIGYTVSLSR